MLSIVQAKAREILDSRGYPTLEVELKLSNESRVRAMVPSGASTGQFEALELRDGDSQRYHGKGVKKVLQLLEDKVFPKILGLKLENQPFSVDRCLLELDSTPNKSALGANGILAVSLAVTKAAALSYGLPLYQFLGGSQARKLPVPLMNVLNGGAHADNGLDVQEFMIVPHGFVTFSEALRAGSEIFHTLKKLLQKKNLPTAVGDEGGFAPKLSGNEQALTLLVEAIEKSGYRLGEQVSLALDVASSEFYQDAYYHFEGKKLSGEALTEIYKSWVQKYPIISIEDAWAEEDFASWIHGTRELGSRIQLVGDDLFVTQVSRLQKGIESQMGNSLLVKMNQVGTISETIEAVHMAQEAAYVCVMSHRSGETEDVTIAHLAVGLSCQQIKTGGLCRSERIAKYNELLRIEDELLSNHGQAWFWGSKAFKHLNS